MFIECRYHGRRIYRQHVRLVQYDNFLRGGGETIFTGVTFEAAGGTGGAVGPPENSNQSGPRASHFLGPGDSPSPPSFFPKSRILSRKSPCPPVNGRQTSATFFFFLFFFFFFFSSQSLPRSEPLIFYASLEHPLTSPPPPHTKSFKQSRRKKRKERHTKGIYSQPTTDGLTR